MINVVYRRQYGSLGELIVDGHDSTREKGDSLVCAAVSALLHSLEVGLLQVVEESVLVSKAVGYTRFVAHKTPSSAAHAQIEMIFQTLKVYGLQFPESLKIQEFYCGT